MKYSRSFGLYIFKGIIAFCLLTACRSEKKQSPIFELLESKTTGLHFSNTLVSTDSFNLFKYMYFYNGAGIGAGDFNNDGLTDVFFSSNMGANKMYLNAGELRFNDVTAAAGIPNDGAWSTGVSVADVNNDGMLDIYVCRVGNFENLHSKNQLLICTGINNKGVPEYQDQAKEYGLDFSGFSTQAAFFDYDMDGDLDMFLLNHSIHQNSNYAPRKNFIGTLNPLSGDRLFRNDNNTFTDVTAAAGINSSAIGYGLGITVSDINADGFPDIYIGNDFHENDYLYINQQNGTFTEEGAERLMHTSQFTMGVDAGDINNDGLPEIISVDMLSADATTIKRSLGENEYDVFNMKIDFGYNYQYTRNNLQLNRNNGLFSEIGLYSQVAATDWSWSPLWLDFDNDGLKDLFISNGIPKRMNDIDYINFVSDQQIQQKIIDNKMNETDAILIDKFPRIKLPNKFYKNDGQLAFSDQEKRIGNDKPTYSNGAVYADFDNDGDLDILVNNIDEPAMLYKNNSSVPGKETALQIHLTGPPGNLNAIGAKVILFAGAEKRVYEKFPVHGFQSSMEIPVHVGLENTTIDSLIVVWPDRTYVHIQESSRTNVVKLKHQAGLPLFNFEAFTTLPANSVSHVQDITDAIQLKYLHTENKFAELNREPLLPHMLSTEGPAMAVADINHDGLDDVYLGAARDHKAALFLQLPGGRFQQVNSPAIAIDSAYEDVDAIWTDVNNDGHPDLIVASGGNEFYGADIYRTPRVYLNDGKANLTVLPNAFSGVFVTASTIAPVDFNGDGFMDVFVGGRTVPWEYGISPASFLLQNDGTGKFRNVTAAVAAELAGVGMVTHAIWTDIDNDKDADLVLALEWGAITVFMNHQGKFTKKQLTTEKGWWNFVLPLDVDGDGDIDLVAGNLGLNSRLQATTDQPVRMYYNDFDDNGKREQVLTYYMQGREIPFANKLELEKQIPIIKKNFLYAKDLAEASLDQIFTKAKLKSSAVLTADYFSNAIFINDGKANFTVSPLPYMAQLTSLRSAVPIEVNGDGLPDLLLAGNYFENNVEMGRYDADFGTVLVNKGNGNFAYQPTNGLQLKGQTRRLKKLIVAGQPAVIVARNNDSVAVITFAPKLNYKK